jgi:hypothetical protein
MAGQVALAALAAEVVEKLRVNSILQDIAADVRDRSFKPECADLIKRLKKPSQGISQPRTAKTEPAALSPAVARKLLEKQRGRFARYDGLLTFITDDESILTESNLAVLAAVADLGRANLGSKESPLTAAGLAHLARLKKLRALGLRHVANDEMLAIVGRIAALRELSLYHAAKVNDRSLRHLAGLTQLEALEIGRTACDGSGLAHLPAAKLKSLELTELKLSPKGAKAIGRFTRLESLRMPFATVPKGFFHELAGLKRLRELNLYRAKLPEDAAQHLLKMTWLKALDVRDTGISPTEQTEVRRALKKTKVEYDR